MLCCVKKRRARSHGAVSAMLARLYVFNKESTMTIDRQSIVYFINEKGDPDPLLYTLWAPRIYGANV